MLIRLRNLSARVYKNANINRRGFFTFKIKDFAEKEIAHDLVMNDPKSTVFQKVKAYRSLGMRGVFKKYGLSFFALYGGSFVITFGGFFTLISYNEERFHSTLEHYNVTQYVDHLKEYLGIEKGDTKSITNLLSAWVLTELTEEIRIVLAVLFTPAFSRFLKKTLKI